MTTGTADRKNGAHPPWWVWPFLVVPFILGSIWLSRAAVMVAVAVVLFVFGGTWGLAWGVVCLVLAAILVRVALVRDILDKN